VPGTAFFPSIDGTTSTYDAFALQVGGGIDVKVNGRIAFRPVEANWLRTTYPNSTTNVQNNLRLGAGVVFRLQRKLTHEGLIQSLVHTKLIWRSSFLRFKRI
jgi:hypothetical protein